MDVRETHWIAGVPPPDREVQVRFRYRSPLAAAVLEPAGGDRVRVRFHAAQRSVAQGQSAVFYRGDRVLGGGVIDRALRDVSLPNLDN
jgi:tRNA-specific 2-thiouridylase